MQKAAFLPAGIIAIGLYLLVASALAFSGGVIAIGTLAIAVTAAAGMTTRTQLR